MGRQLRFDFPRRTALGRDDFFVGPSNAVAVALIDGWAQWPDGKLVLTGPAGAGKTHLTHVWAELAGARILSARDLSFDAIPEIAAGPSAIEDIPEIAGDPEAQRSLFHLHNLARSEGQPLMVTGVGSVADWGLALPDLVSRLQAATVAPLEAPDDTLLSALLVKLFADRGLTPPSALIPYLIQRMDRSYAAAAEIVALLDAESLAEGRKLGIRLARDLLDKAGRPD